jgi:hypothetical protein
MEVRRPSSSPLLLLPFLFSSSAPPPSPGSPRAYVNSVPQRRKVHKTNESMRMTPPMARMRRQTRFDLAKANRQRDVYFWTVSQYLSDYSAPKAGA